MSAKERNPYDPPKRKIRFGRILFYIVSLALIVLLVAILFNVIITRKSGEPPSVFGYSLFIVTTPSMQGTLDPGSAVLVHKVDPDTLAVGDIITFKEGYDPDGKLVVNTHRIVNIEEAGDERVFRTKGDNNNVEDDKIRTEEDILGKEIASLPAVGKFFAFIKQPIGLITCIAIPLLILLVFEVFNLIRLSKGSKKNKEFLDDAPHGSVFDEDVLPAKTKKRAALFDEGPDDSSGDSYLVNSESGAGESPIPYGEGSSASPRVAVPAAPPLVRPAWEPNRQPIQSPRADLQGLVSGAAFAKTESAAANGDRYHLNIHAEPDNTPLENVSETFDGVSYIKPVASREAPIYRTQEFNVREPVEQAPLHPMQTPVFDTETPPETVFHSEGNSADFAADLAVKGRDRFKIEGIAVNVKPDALKLSLDENSKGRDISITVTNEYTNVTVGSDENEVNFALFRDNGDDGQKVIIQRKNR